MDGIVSTGNCCFLYGIIEYLEFDNNTARTLRTFELLFQYSIYVVVWITQENDLGIYIIKKDRFL